MFEILKNFWLEKTSLVGIQIFDNIETWAVGLFMIWLIFFKLVPGILNWIDHDLL